MTDDTAHWHVTRHSEDDDPALFADVYAALEYAADELACLVEFWHEGITPAGENEDYEGAYKAFVKAELYSDLVSAANHAPGQHHKPRADRAPLYAAPDYEGGPFDERNLGYLGDNDPQSVLFQTALRHVQKINSESPVEIFDCTAPLETVDHCDECGPYQFEYVTCTAMGGTGDGSLLEEK